MFAVKGWSVDAAALKPQTEIFKSAKSAEDGAAKSGKKRKRDHHGKGTQQDPNVRPDDVGRLWQQHIEGGGLSHSQKDRKRKKHKPEPTESDKPSAREPVITAKDPDGNVESHEKSEDIVLGPRLDKLDSGKPKKKKKRRHENTQAEQQDLNGDSDRINDASKGSSATSDSDKRKQRQAVLPAPETPVPSTLTPMQSAMRQKLISARFRHLNETLYTETSSKAQALFEQNPEMFQDYHAGFRQQVSIWPENPLDKFIDAIRTRGKVKAAAQIQSKKRKAKSKPKAPERDPGLALPRTNGTSVIADLGCGDARLAHTLTVSGDTSTMNLKLHSFDLHGISPYVTKADIANVPLKDQSVDVAILCLSLMGTNWISFIEEAHRILRWKGELWIAEIKSRFGRVSKAGQPVDHSVGSKRKQAEARKVQEVKAKEQEENAEQATLQTQVDGVVPTKEETDVSAFVEVMRRRGFLVKPPNEKHLDLTNKMFVKMEFVKALTPIKGKSKPEADDRKISASKTKFLPAEDEEIATDDEAKVLKPCLYKLR